MCVSGDMRERAEGLTNAAGGGGGAVAPLADAADAAEEEEEGDDALANFLGDPPSSFQVVLHDAGIVNRPVEVGSSPFVFAALAFVALGDV